MLALLEDMSVSGWEGVANRWGLPIIMLVAGGFGLWRFAQWFAPLAQSLVSGHLKFMETINERTTSLVTKTDRTNELLEQIRKELKP